jgi:hypothetical protein
MRIIDALSERPMRVSGRTSGDSLRPPLDGTAHRCSDDDEDQLDWPDRLRGILRGGVGGRLAASMDALAEGVATVLILLGLAGFLLPIIRKNRGA